MSLATLVLFAPKRDVMQGIIIAAVIAFLAAILFPAAPQSKIWIKVFGSQWGTVAGGRAWTFLAVFVSGSLLWGFLLWLPTHQ